MWSIGGGWKTIKHKYGTVGTGYILNGSLLNQFTLLKFIGCPKFQPWINQSTLLLEILALIESNKNIIPHVRCPCFFKNL